MAILKRHQTRAAMALMLAGLCRGQDVLHTYHGRWGDLLAQVASAGDVDLDGVNDFVVGAYEGHKPGQSSGGMVALYSGATFELLLPPIWGPTGHQWGEKVAGIGDFDGDGILDFAAGSSNGPPPPPNADGEAYAWSGATGNLLAYIPSPWGDDLGFGAEVKGLGDLNQDGYSEFAVAYQENLTPVFIFRGPDAKVIRTHRPYNPKTGQGPAGEPDVSSIGDLNGDGVPEYVIGWPVGDGTGAKGVIITFDGATGAELHRVHGPTEPGAFDGLGRSTADMGDVDGDGVPDYAAGATFCVVGCLNGYRGYAQILSGADGSLIRRIDAPRLSAWYILAHEFEFLDGGEDVNGDGIGDLIAGSPGANKHYDEDFSGDVHGMVEVFSGATGTRLWVFHPGFDGALLGDLDGDGLSEFTWGNIWESAAAWFGGQITVFKGAPGDAQRVCTANANSTGNAARLDLEGPISVSNNLLHLVVEGGVPNEAAIFFYGSEYVWQPFGDGVLCAGGGNLGLRRIGPPVFLDVDGMVIAPVDMTEAPMGKGPAAWTPGSTWVVQAWYRDPAGASGFNLTDALQVTWTP